MAIKTINNQNIKDEISSGTTIVDYWAEWCEPCKVLSKVLDGLVNKYDGVKVGKVDITDQLELAKEYKISNIPCLIVFRDGKEVERVVGFKNAGSVEDLFIKYSE
jgi:thioredoxin 1